MSRFLLSAFALLFVALNGFAQQATTVTGTVTDMYGPLYGAAVVVEGTTIGTSTDALGKFSINVPDPATAVLKFTFVGYNDLRENINGRISVNVNMVELANSLEDVVVIGYGTQKRGNLTGAVASVSGKVLEKTPVASVADALVGKLPGVQITSMDGSPDAEINIRVRGGGSLTNDNSPLILVDGFEVSSLNDVPPTDIETVDVLKDAASTAIYGARGANGVIIVTTKKPVAGRVNVNVNTYLQIRTLANKLDMMDPYEFVTMQYEEARRTNSIPSGFYAKYGQNYEMYLYQGIEGRDWQDEIFGSNPVSKYADVNVTGGTERTKYKFSYIFQDLPSVMKSNGRRQDNINVSFDTKLHDRLTFEYRTRFTNKVIKGAGTGDEGVNFIDILKEAPTQGLDDFMNLPSDNTYYDPDLYEEVVHFDPYQVIEKNYRKRTTRTFNTTAALNWNIIEGLYFRTEFGYQHEFYEDERYWGTDTNKANQNNYLPVIEVENAKRPRWQFTNTLTYNFNLNNIHDFNFMVGQELKQSKSNGKKYGSRYFDEEVTARQALNNIGLGNVYEASSSGGSPVKVSSFFGRVNYGYDDKYLATFTMRVDGSTKFGPGNKWGVFPAGAVAWRISNEDFLKGNQTVSDLKLRLSYGVAGNDRISSDLWTKYYKVSRRKPLGWGEASGSEENYYYDFYKDELYNENVKWESTITRNIGIDFGFFRQRLNGTIDVYWNTTKDLLVSETREGASGWTSAIVNAGQTSNRGVELALNGYIIEKKDWTLSANMNIGYNKRKIDKLASGESEWVLQSGWAGTQLLNTDDYRAYVGGQTGLIYGFVNDGFYTVDDFTGWDSANGWSLKDGVVDCSNLSGNPAPGNAKFKKLTPYDGNDPNTWVIGDDDRQVIGNTTPKFSGGFGLNATWKGFDVTLFFNYMYGFDVYNANKLLLTSFYRNNRNNMSMEVSSSKRWRNYDDMGNQLNRDPVALAKFNEKATIWNPVSLTRPIAMSWAIEDGSFLRLNTAIIGYTIPQHITRKAGIQRLRVYATGYNLFTLTGYTGYDPEVNIDGGLTPNIDHNAYPRSRTYTFGLQLTF